MGSPLPHVNICALGHEYRDDFVKRSYILFLLLNSTLFDSTSYYYPLCLSYRAYHQPYPPPQSRPPPGSYGNAVGGGDCGYHPVARHLLASFTSLRAQRSHLHHTELLALITPKSKSATLLACTIGQPHFGAPSSSTRPRSMLVGPRSSNGKPPRKWLSCS